jgi:hypothetical protein
MPFAVFDAIKTREAALAFFEREFGDAIPLMGGTDAVLDMLLNNPVGPLITVKASISVLL